ncbi:MAG: amidase [Azospirillaceae bacterium]
MTDARGGETGDGAGTGEGRAIAFATGDEPGRERGRVAGAADGPLAGLRFAVKDIFDIAGEVTGCGNPDWRASHSPAAATAASVQRLLDAGASSIGKTLTDELAFSLNGENHHYGTPPNPAAPGRIPGGSSAGSASAVAAGTVDFALGTDTGGSVRIPGSYCGVWGLRPSHGAVPIDGVMPLAPSFDTVGWFAREPDLLVRIGDVLLPHGPERPPARVLWAEDAFEEAFDDARPVLEAAADRLARAIGPVTRGRVSQVGLAEWHPRFSTLQWREIWRTHGAWIEARRPRFGPGVDARFQAASMVDDASVREAAAFREVASAALDALLPPDTVMILPSAPGIAPEIGLGQDTLTAFRNRALRLTCVAGLGRLPQVTIPAATVDGCPVGVSLVGARGTDRSLLAIAATAWRALSDEKE